MSGFQIELRSFEPELSGAPVVVDVLDDELQRISQQTLTVGDPHRFDVSVGRYGVRVFLPSGQSLTDSVVAEDEVVAPHVIDLSEISPHESMRRTVVLKSAPSRTRRTLDEVGYRSLWLRLWARSEGTWRVEPWPRPMASWDSDAVRYWLQTERRQHMLQIGGPHIPWRMVSLPAAQRLEVTMSPSNDEGPPRLAITVATDNNVVEALLGYLTVGALGHAGLVNMQAEELLFGKVADPAAAAVGGYYLLRVSDLERLHRWPQNLANWTQWMPDGAVIHAWQLIREQQEAHEPSGVAMATARDRLLNAVERGTPVYTEGLRLLVAGLKLLDFEADGRDREIRDAIDRIRPFVAAADLAQPTTTFTGSSPLVPSTAPAYGLPRSRTGLAFLYNVQLQDLAEFGLIETETPLSLLGFAFPPAEARLTPRATIQLRDGREFTDPSTAAVEAALFDPWFSWAAPGGATLGGLRQRAREGRIGDQTRPM